jgi:hypothetical protein
MTRFGQLWINCSGDIRSHRRPAGFATQALVTLGLAQPTGLVKETGQ